MKFKLDENFGTRTQAIFHAAGYDAETVLDEALGGATDQQLYEACLSEQRCLVTLDLDFANVVRFSPSKGAGIAVIRLPRNSSLNTLEQLVSQFLQALQTTSISNRLWIVEPKRIRVHQSDQEIW